eukprot:COSAG05_NODE_1441_length_4880_cov_3.567245_8_plen_178_part_00
MLLGNGTAPQLDATIIDHNSQTGSDAVKLRVRLTRGPNGQIPTCTLALAMGDSKHSTQKKPAGFDTRAIQLVSARLPSLTPQELERSHVASYAWWRGFWDTSSVSFSTRSALGQRLEAFYCGSSFLLAASSRSGEVAPGLYGPWLTTDHPMWGGDFHMCATVCHPVDDAAVFLVLPF